MILLRVLFFVALVASLPVQFDHGANTDSTMSKRSIWSSILSLFDGGSSNSAAPASAATPAGGLSAVPNIVNTATAVPPATTPAVVPTITPAITPAVTPANTLVATPAVTTAPTTVPSDTGSGGGWLSKLLGLFDTFAQSSSATAIPATVPATTAVSPLTTPYATAASQTVFTPAISSTSSFIAGTLSPVSTATTRLNPAFSGLVTVVGAGGTQTVATNPGNVVSGTSGSASTSTSSVGPSNSQIQAVAKYAEMGAGISYSPYTKSGSCKTAQEVQQDISMLSGHTLIRLYSVDCEGIANVVAAISPAQKLFLGIWDISAINTDLPSMAQQVLTGTRGWDAVHTVSIGNEVVNSGTNTVAQVASAVANARSWFKQNAPDYSGFIVAVDTLAATMTHPQMCDISDYLAVNCHPYFSGVEASTSGTWLQQQIDSLSSFCGGNKQILITESGWPTEGNTEGQAVPSINNQLLAVKGLATVVGKQVMMFTTYNDYWKAPGSWNVEQHWGIYGNPAY